MERTDAKRNPEETNAETEAKRFSRSHVACAGTDNAAFRGERSTKRREWMSETKCLRFARLVEACGVKRKSKRPALRLLEQARRKSAATNDQTAIAKRSNMSPNGNK